MSTPSLSAPLSPARRVTMVLRTFAAMSGWRFEHLTVPWIVGGVASLALGRALMVYGNVVATSAFFVFALLFYYGGNTIILTSRLPARLVQRFGEDRAFRIYETVLALMFINQGLGVGCMSALQLGSAWRWPIAPIPTYALGGALFATGLVVKVWSTVVVGIDVYYYRDMFLGRPVSEFSNAGPYRVLSNPMYGVGQLHAYGYAILSRSVVGVLATALCHALIYGFYFAAEQPFIRRVYLREPLPGVAA